jgi:hypothetical protein
MSKFVRIIVENLSSRFYRLGQRARPWARQQARPGVGHAFEKLAFKQKARLSWTALVVLGLVSLAMLSGLALARVPLGSSVPVHVRGKISGPYWLAFYTRSCLEPKLLERQWESLRAAKLEVLAVNPVENGNVAAPIPKDFLGMTGPQALELSRSLKVKSYPTTVLVDAKNVIRVVLEGPVSSEQVRESLNLLPATP